MKRLFLMLVVALFMLPQLPLSASADKTFARVNIPMKIVPGTRLGRSLADAPVEVVYWGMSATLQITCLYDCGDSNLTVANTTTGESWYCSLASGVSPQILLPLSGTEGCYVIYLVTASGDIYEGEFLIE